MMYRRRSDTATLTPAGNRATGQERVGMDKTRFLDRRTPPHIATLVLLTGAGALNMNIILPSLPGIADYFQVSYSYVQLLISAYLAATAVMQLIVGPFSDRYGRRPVMLVCASIFLAATLLWRGCSEL